MVWVNLLPWRHRQLKAKWHRDCLIVLVMSAACLFALLPTLGLRTANEQRVTLVRRMQQANKQLDALKARSVALTQQQQQLRRKAADYARQRERVRQWHDFTLKLPDLMPEMLWLSGLSKTADNLTFSGFCPGMADIDNFRLRLEQLPLFRRVTTGKLSRNPQGIIQFSLLATLVSLEGTDE